MKFRKKPVVIEAVQWTGDNVDEVLEFVGGELPVVRDEKIFISTLEGVMRGDIGDWIIRGVKGELYPCKPDVFEATYEAVEE